MNNYPFTKNTASQEARRGRISLLPLPLTTVVPPSVPEIVAFENAAPQGARRHRQISLLPLPLTTVVPPSGYNDGELPAMPKNVPHAHASRVHAIPTQDVGPNRNPHGYEKPPSLDQRVLNSLLTVERYYQCGRDQCDQTYVSFNRAHDHVRGECKKSSTSTSSPLVKRVRMRGFCCPDPYCCSVHSSRQNVGVHVQSRHFLGALRWKPCNTAFKRESTPKRRKKDHGEQY